jgi:long-chain fatty acid transport protein
MLTHAALKRLRERKMRRIGLFSLASAAAAMFSAPALSASYGIKEQSADAMAVVYAGAAATESDASYLAYNPASLSGVKDSDASISVIVILPGTKGNYTSATTTVGSPTGGLTRPSGFISGATVPALSYRQRLSERWSIGLSISAPWGLRTDYPSNWAGRYYGRKSELLTIDVMPVVSYQVTPNLSFGAGLQVQYAKGTLTSVIDTGTIGVLNSIPGSIPGGQDSFAQLTGQSWNVGFTAGLIDRIGDVTLGIAYRSSLQHDLKGPLTFTLDKSGIGAAIRAATGLFTDTKQTTPITTPDMITSGARLDISDAWTALLEVDWTHWSKVRELRVHAANPAQPDDVTTTRWRDTYFASLGAEYRVSPLWTIRAGTGYDQTPATNQTRDPRLPDADRVWLSAGVRYRIADNMDVNVTASRLFFLQGKVDLNPAIPGAALRGSLAGTTDAYVNVIGLQFDYRAE